MLDASAFIKVERGGPARRASTLGRRTLSKR
jgi:hypothetical protein